MTTPLSPSKIDDLLSELQLLETKQTTPMAAPSPVPLSFIPVPPPKLTEVAVKKEVVQEQAAPAPSNEAPAKKINTFAITAVASLLFFALGLFSADFFITGTEEISSNEVIKTTTILSGYDPAIAALQPYFSQLAKEREAFLIKAIDEGHGDLNKKVMDIRNLTSLSLLNAWQTISNEDLRREFIDLAEKEGLGSFLPAQVTSEEKLRPLYYFSDSWLHLNLNNLHQNILNDIP